MMRIAVVGDFHGNRPATIALEEDLCTQRVDAVYCLGDLVGKGPRSDFTFDWVIKHCDVIVKGNWDIGIGKKLYPNDQCYFDQLGQEALNTLLSFPKEAELELSGKKIRFMHGRPIMKELVMVQDSKNHINPLFVNEEGKIFDMVLYADSHRQGLRTMNCGLFANCGSVGNALGVPKCCYALLEGDPHDPTAPFELRFRQISYNVEEAVADAEAKKGIIPNMDLFIQEITTGRYQKRVLPTAQG